MITTVWCTGASNRSSPDITEWEVFGNSHYPGYLPINYRKFFWMKTISAGPGESHDLELDYQLKLLKFSLDCNRRFQTLLRSSTPFFLFQKSLESPLSQGPKCGRDAITRPVFTANPEPRIQIGQVLLPIQLSEIQILLVEASIRNCSAAVRAADSGSAIKYHVWRVDPVDEFNPLL